MRRYQIAVHCGWYDNRLRLVKDDVVVAYCTGRKLTESDVKAIRKENPDLYCLVHDEVFITEVDISYDGLAISIIEPSTGTLSIAQVLREHPVCLCFALGVSIYILSVIFS